MAVTASLTATGSARPSPRTVLFDATGSRSTTESTRNLAYRHLLYFMDFGDGTSGNWGDGTYGHAGAQTGLPRNEEWSPIGSHVYEVADGAGDKTFTATLYVTDGATTDSATQNITVRDPNGALGYASTLVVATDGVFTGKPAGATELTSSDYDSAITTTAGSGATHQRILFKRAQTFTCDTTVTFSVDGPIHVGAWGSGAAPLIENTVNGNMNNVTTGDDISFADLEMDGNSNAASVGVVLQNSGGTGAKRTLVLRCNIHHFHYGIQAAANLCNVIYDGLSIFDSSITNAIGGTAGNLLFITSKNMAVMGCLVSDATAAEHVFRSGYTNVGVFGHNYMLNPASMKHVVKLHENNSTAGNADGGITQFCVFIHDRFKGGTGCPWIVTLGPQDDITDETVETVLLDSCWFEPQTDTQRQCLVWADDVTARNCLVIMDNTTSHGGFEVAVRGIEPAHDNFEGYNNTFYGNDAASFVPFIISTGTGHIVKNNLAWAPSSTSQDMVQGTATESNNSTVAQMAVDSNTDATNGPFFAGSNGNGTGTFVNPSDFKLITGSYGIASGVATTNLGSFFKPTTRINVTPDMGFHQLNAGDVFPAAGGGGGGGLLRRIHTEGLFLGA